MPEPPNGTLRLDREGPVVVVSMTYDEDGTALVAHMNGVEAVAVSAGLARLGYEAIKSEQEEPTDGDD